MTDAAPGAPDERDDLLRIAEAAQRLLTDDANLVESLQGVAGAGCDLLDGCSAASITILELDLPMTITATSDLATALDSAQYIEDDGPCLHAARTVQLVYLDDVAAEPRWPIFSKAAAMHDIGSALCVPLVLVDAATFGGLNYYGDGAHAFDESDIRIAQSFAAQASMVVSNAIAYWSAFDQAANLTKAMEHRAEIEQAKGIIMATQKCTADQAFDLLRRASQRENRKLRELAAEIVLRTSEGNTG